MTLTLLAFVWKRKKEVEEKNREKPHFGQITDTTTIWQRDFPHLVSRAGVKSNSLIFKLDSLLSCVAPHVEGTYQSSHPEAKSWLLKLFFHKETTNQCFQLQTFIQQAELDTRKTRCVRVPKDAGRHFYLTFGQGQASCLPRFLSLCWLLVPDTFLLHIY